MLQREPVKLKPKAGFLKTSGCFFFGKMVPRNKKPLSLISVRFLIKGPQIHSERTTEDFVGSFFKCINSRRHCIYDQQIEFWSTVKFLILSKTIHVCELC